MPSVFAKILAKKAAFERSLMCGIYGPKSTKIIIPPSLEGQSIAATNGLVGFQLQHPGRFFILGSNP
ncbi:unnamed protein product [Prunus armeniaca]|uniref:Uncharacterized protein n=1 Tax=Prunus armeniaca TaxID=36596 RepID=A0A6J5XXW6_PRUAR|nr:unnamed protein product [Prunus armeniaca]